MLYMFVLGFGLGACMQTLTLAAQNAGPIRDMGVSTSSATFFRQIGGTLGTAVFLSVLFSTVGDKIASAIRSAFATPAFHAALAKASTSGNADDRTVAAMLTGHGGNTSNVLQDSSFLQRIDSGLAHPFLVGFSQSINLVFWLMGGVMVIAFLVTWFIKEIPLRTMSGVQAMAAGEGGAVTPEPEVVPVTASEPAVRDLAGVGVGRHALSSGAESTSLLDGLTADRINGVATNGSTAGTPVHGRVRRGDDGAVTGAVLTLINHAGQQVARTTSGPDGAYQLTAPLDGVYVLIVSAAGHQPHASTVHVAGARLTVDVVLTGTARLRGVLYSAGRQSVVASATVTLTDLRGEVVGATTSDADGRYEFEELLGGDYTLVVSAAKHRPIALAVTAPGSGESVTDVELPNAARLTGVALSGPDNRPVRDARVTLVDSGGNVVAMTTTDTAGEYAFPDLSEGEYTVIASGYPPASSHCRVSAGGDQRHDVELSHSDI